MLGLTPAEEEILNNVARQQSAARNWFGAQASVPARITVGGSWQDWLNQNSRGILLVAGAVFVLALMRRR